MADIELVIKIPESILNTIQADEMISREQLAVLQMHILNGIPLPKGHGDLIDRNEAEKIADEKFEHITSSLLNHIQTYDVYNLLEATPTIIEADKEESEEERLGNICTQRCCLKNHNMGIIECNEECSNRTLF